jgi:hypothetical protein
MENEVPEKRKRTLKDLMARMVSSKKRKTLTIVLGVGALLAIGIVIALFTGWLAVIAKTPGQKVVVVASVCNEAKVNKFNTIMDGYYGDGDTQTAGADLSSLITDITKNSSYKQDPTCVFMKYRQAVLSSDYQTAKDMVDQLGRLAKTGKYTDAQVKGLTSIDTMGQALNQIAPNKKETF